MGMEITLVVLVLAGLLLIYATLRARLGSFAGEIRSLSDEITKISNQPRSEPSPVIDVGPLESKINDLGRRLSEALEDTRFLRDEVVERRGHRLREEIERYFRFAGYQSVNVLSELGVFDDEPVRVAVTGVKGGITYKGYVVIETGRIVEEKMTSSHEVFP